MARKKRILSRRRRSVRLWAILVPLGLILLAPPVATQQPGMPGRDVTQPWITVAPPAVAEEDPRNEALALVIADNLELTLRLIGEYVVRPRPTERTAPSDTASAAAYADREEIDYVVFGEVSDRADGSTEFSLFVYSRETGTVTLERRAVAETIFETFDVADELAAEVLGAFTGQRIAYGRVELANLGETGAEYQVRVDGTVVGRNLTALERVLVGDRLVEVEVLSGPQAGEIVASRRFLVEEGARERLEFSALAPLPVPEPEELLVEVPEEPEEEPEPAIAAESEPEPEIPLELRAYQWRRNDPGRDWAGSLAYQLHVENRPDWDESLLLMGIRGRLDWGERHSLLLGYEGTQDDTVGDHDRSRFFSESEVGEQITFEPGPLQRVYVGYGLRSRPLGPLTVIPSLRAGIERQYYLAVAGDRVGWEEIPDVLNPDNEYSRPFWAGSLGLDLALELTLRRFLLYASAGAMGVVPFDPEYEEIILGRDGSTGEAIEFLAQGSIDSEIGWYAGLGIGYAFGGSEEAVDRESTESRPFRSFSDQHARNWGVSFGLEAGVAQLIGGGFVNAFPWPFPKIGSEFGHTSGLVIDAHFSLSSLAVRPATFLWAFEEDPDVQSIEEGTQEAIFEPVFTFGIGRRLRVGEHWYLKLQYRVGLASEESGRIESDTLSYGGDFEDIYVHGPRVVLEHSIPGTAATVYSSGYVLMAGPLGETDYSTGFRGRGGTVIAADGYGEGNHQVGLDVGVLFRLAGMPPRLLSEDSRGEWRSYSGPSRAASGAAEENGFFRSQFAPRLAMGVGIEWVPAPAVSTEDYHPSGFMAVFPLTVRFPFGLELVAKGGVPFTGSGTPEGPRSDHMIPSDQLDAGAQEVTGKMRLVRYVSFEVGYRFRRFQRLSLRTGLSVTWMDVELWSLENTLPDGTVIRGGDSRFARSSLVPYAGPSLDVQYRLSDRISLNLTGSTVVRGDGEQRANPAFSPAVQYGPPTVFTFLGGGVTLEL